MTNDRTLTSDEILKAAAALADNLELTLVEGEPVLEENQLVLVVSKQSIEFGIIKVHKSQIRSFVSTEYTLNGKILTKEVQKQDETGMIDVSKRVNYYPEDASIFIGE